MMSGDNSEIKRAWQYLHIEKIKRISMLSGYGKKYKQYLINDCTSNDVQQYKSQLKLFSPDLLTVVELLAESDIINQLKFQKQDYSHLSQKLKHIYDERFWYIHSYRPSRNNLTNYIYYLNEFIQNKSVDNKNKKPLLILSFHLAYDMFNKYFTDRKFLH
ncbi:hypothetical protein [Anaerospora sp.]|uniref:hypothetical protein n=1 Tax=Anaerospora sp. TaxID=1960278 RepID=UPI0028994CEB|nr:hypothetical protein [Anaerospora sp.]